MGLAQYINSEKKSDDRRLAYTYITYKKDKVLTEIAKRLQTMKFQSSQDLKCHERFEIGGG